MAQSFLRSTYRLAWLFSCIGAWICTQYQRHQPQMLPKATVSSSHPLMLQRQGSGDGRQAVRHVTVLRTMPLMYRLGCVICLDEYEAHAHLIGRHTLPLHRRDQCGSTSAVSRMKRAEPEIFPARGMKCVTGGSCYCIVPDN